MNPLTLLLKHKKGLIKSLLLLTILIVIAICISYIFEQLIIIPHQISKGRLIRCQGDDCWSQNKNYDIKYQFPIGPDVYYLTYKTTKNIIDQPFECVSSNTENSKTKPLIINDHIYCLTKEYQAPTNEYKYIMISLTYTFPKGQKMGFIKYKKTFSDQKDMKKSFEKLEKLTRSEYAEKMDMDLDLAIDRIAQSMEETTIAEKLEKCLPKMHLDENLFIKCSAILDSITNFNDCVNAGFIPTDSTPKQCIINNKHIFIEGTDKN